MRLTNKLFAQHIGWHFKKHWQVQGKRVARDTGAEEVLQKYGVFVKEPTDLINPVRSREKIEIVGSIPPPLTEDESHPNWHDRGCYVYNNSNVLLEGMAQAQVLTNTMIVDGFPKDLEDKMDRLKLPNHVDKALQTALLASHVYDAEQVKLPPIRLPERPRYVLPRAYGISHERRSRLLLNKVIAECEKLCSRSVLSRRRIVDNAHFAVNLERDEMPLQFNVNVDKLMTSSKALDPIKGKLDGDLPDLYPLKATVSLPKINIYNRDTFYPVSTGFACSNLHTIFLHFDKEVVRNLHKSIVSTTQFQSRNLLIAFATAAARAKVMYGENINTLPKPVVVQSVQTDGRSFHFGIFQLNTMALNADNAIKNFWYHSPNMDIFEACEYKAGRPICLGYNKDVFRYFYVLYNN